MQNLSSLLERIVSALHTDTALKNAVCEAVKECTGGTIQDTDITVKDGILTICASPALKNELRLKEEKVLACVLEKSGKRIVRILYA